MPHSITTGKHTMQCFRRWSRTRMRTRLTKRCFDASSNLSKKCTPTSWLATSTSKSSIQSRSRSGLISTNLTNSSKTRHSNKSTWNISSTRSSMSRLSWALQVSLRRRLTIWRCSRITRCTKSYSRSRTPSSTPRFWACKRIALSSFYTTTCK